MRSLRSLSLARAANAVAIAATALVAPGCDPVFDVAGSFFPAWMLCLLVGCALAALLRLVFARIGVEPYLGPLPLVYGCLAALITMATWLVFFRV
jgi:hypothetical protein